MSSIDVTFISNWDDGIEISTPAKYNPETGVVHDVVSVDPVEACGQEVDILNYECIVLPDKRVLFDDEFTLED